MSASVYAWVTRFHGEGEPAPAISFYSTMQGCQSVVTVAAITTPVELARLTFAPSGGVTQYSVAAGPHTAINTPWIGQPGDGVLTGGSTLRIWTPTGGVFLVKDERSNSIISQIRLLAGAQDPTKPSVTVAAISPFQSNVTLTGTAQAGCSGLANMSVRVVQASSGLNWTGTSFSALPALPIPVMLTSPGASSSTWTANLTGFPFALGSTYSFTFTDTSAAGTSSPPVTMNGTSQLVPDRYVTDLPPGALTTAFYGELRAASPQISLGYRNATPDNVADLTWGNNVTHTFSLTYDASARTISVNVEGNNVDASTNATASMLSDMELRAVSTPNSTIALTNMQLAGQPLPALTSSGGQTGIQVFHTANLIKTGFVLTGTIRMSWNGTMPTGSSLGVQIWPGHLN